MAARCIRSVCVRAVPVVAATSEPGRVVTNGMSQYSRNERNANAGIVVGITPEQDFPGGPLAGVEFQEQLESKAYELGGRDYCAPGTTGGRFYSAANLHLNLARSSLRINPGGVKLGDPAIRRYRPM